MKTFNAVVERCTQTGLFIGYVPGLPGVRSQGETLDELSGNLKDVLQMLNARGPFSEEKWDVAIPRGQ